MPVISAVGVASCECESLCKLLVNYCVTLDSLCIDYSPKLNNDDNE
jgi:hypothetical protein